MGTWTLTVTGTDEAANLGPAFNSFVDELNKVGHKITGARVLTDKGESTLDLPALIRTGE